jgi:uncharacterized protein (TIGR02594 family)
LPLSIASSEAATIKKRAGHTYSCTIYKHYERCVRIKKHRKNIKRNRRPTQQVQQQKVSIPQAEWPITYDTTALYSEATRFLGLHERTNINALQSLIRINPARIPWCAAFVNAILGNKGYKGSGSNQARSFLKYGVATSEPRKGDIVVLGRHVGFFEGYIYRNGRKFVAVLGGNQSNRVQISYYSSNRVLSYRKVS